MFLLDVRSKMKPGFQIAEGTYSSYVTREIWKVFGPGCILEWTYHALVAQLDRATDF